MVSHHIVYQLVLFALIWLLIILILHLIRPRTGVSPPVTPAEPEPFKPKRPRSNEPKPSVLRDLKAGEITDDICQCVAAVGRRVHTLCQGETGLRNQLARFQVYHNFVLPHAS